jgi:hypothetical protein
MKILINEHQLHLIKETVNPQNVSDNITGVRSLCNGERGVSWVSNVSENDANQIADMINDCDLDSVRVPSNPHLAFVIYRNGYEKQAKRLLHIAEKYGGFLSVDASDDDTREIGKLLEYNLESVEEYILNRNK